jgi:serine/threonine-protein kinase
VKTITEQIQRTPDDDGRRVARGIAYALLGLRAEAVADGEKSIAIRPTSKDAQFGPYNEHQLARIYTITGQQDLAIDLLQKLLAEPYYLSPAWLRIDPNFAPLRSNPRFQQLIGTKSKPVT